MGRGDCKKLLNKIEISEEPTMAVFDFKICAANKKHVCDADVLFSAKFALGGRGCVLYFLVLLFVARGFFCMARSMSVLLTCV